MTNDGLQPIDTARAIELIQFCHPDRTNITAANSVLDDLYADRRMPQTLIVLARITARFCPDLNTEEGRRALRESIAKHIDLQNLEDDRKDNHR